MPLRRTDDLHAHRWSEATSTYFVTCCTHARRPALTRLPGSSALLDAVVMSDTTGDTTTLAFTAMPDHIHWLFTLGSRLSLGRVIGRWKTGARHALPAAEQLWQRDYYEHRLRPDEDREAYALYIFLNPYRAGLIAPGNSWPYWYCPVPDQFRFTTQIDGTGGIPPEWITDRVPAGLATGE